MQSFQPAASVASHEGNKRSRVPSMDPGRPVSMPAPAFSNRVRQTSASSTSRVLSVKDVHWVFETESLSIRLYSRVAGLSMLWKSSAGKARIRSRSACWGSSRMMTGWSGCSCFTKAKRSRQISHASDASNRITSSRRPVLGASEDLPEPEVFMSTRNGRGRPEASAAVVVALTSQAVPPLNSRGIMLVEGVGTSMV